MSWWFSKYHFIFLLVQLQSVSVGILERLKKKKGEKNVTEACSMCRWRPLADTGGGAEVLFHSETIKTVLRASSKIGLQQRICGTFRDVFFLEVEQESPVITRQLTFKVHQSGQTPPTKI